MFKKSLSAIIGFAFSVAILFMTVNAQGVKFDGYNVPIDIDLNGNYLEDHCKGFLDADGITYVPVRYASEATGAVVTWDDVSADAVVTRGNTTLVFDPATQGCYVNGSWTHAQQKLENGVLYTNANFLFTNLGASFVGWDSYRYEVKVTIPDYYVPMQYVESYYTPEDLHWLSKIVTCEAGSVSFDAKVMVANVILNRRASELFPDTVYDVIYDKKFGIQFPPAHNGKVAKANPTTHTILACKAALNGLELAPGCLYFNYASNKSGWVAKNRTLYKVIGTQAFYL